MSRQMKYRAYGVYGWPGINNKPKMHYFTLFDVGGEYSPSEDVPIMQFTGFTDCNGSEIYEGDIVEYENSNSGYDRPREQEISRQVIPQMDMTDEYAIEVFLNPWWKDGRVIGNIWENPELIE